MVAITRRRRRAGNIVTLSLFFIVGMLGIMAFAIDLGYLHVTRAQLQRTADASAMAAAWELIDVDAVENGPTSNAVLSYNARAAAHEYAALNQVLESSPTLSFDDVEIGYMESPSDPSSEIDTWSSRPPNAVRVRVRRVAGQNGEVPLFFARVLGLNSVASQAEATAAMVNNIQGFRAPSDGSNLGILPFAMDEETWLNLLDGQGSDNWSYSTVTGTISGGPDGVLEANLYPQDTGAPGNRGTVDIGSSNNSTADIARQILNGITPADLDHIGGELVFDENGELFLNGDTGISAGIKDELATIIGRPSVIPIFREVHGPGNNAMFTIVAFAGVRVMEVNLTGKKTSKRVMIQPASVVIPKGAITASPQDDDDDDGGEQTSSWFVYTPVWLVR